MNTLFIEDQKKLTVTGVKAVNSIFEKEIELVLENTKLIIKGNKLSASKLIIEEGILVINGDKILSLNYTNTKTSFSLKSLFK